MQRPRVQGWAAFDQKQRERQSTGTECNVDPYPSISKTISSHSAKSSSKNNSTSIRTFSSTVHPSVVYPSVVGNCQRQVIHDKLKHHADHIAGESDATLIKMLKDIHLWADNSLIKDVLAAVNNDVDQASVLLKAMVSSESKLQDPGLPSSSSSTKSCSWEGSDKRFEESNFVENKISDEDHKVSMPHSSISVPVEPEWEEDDVYLSYRKDARRMTRMASQHSRAASNAFLRGDHISAQQYSLKARDGWIAAEKLNASAAKEILRIRNSNNDIWKLDLHGLHATEAVSALKDHLQKIESEILLNHSASSDALAKLECGISRCVSSEHVFGMEINSEPKSKKELPQQRQTILHVITGIGSHSRGQAALPTAIKSFLIENGYRFDDARPGVFAVRPKFRHKGFNKS